MSSCCVDFKVGQVWVCETCGLEITIAKGCDCLTEGSGTCKTDDCLLCCGKPLKLNFRSCGSDKIISDSK